MKDKMSVGCLRIIKQMKCVRRFTDVSSRHQCGNKNQSIWILIIFNDLQKDSIIALPVIIYCPNPAHCVSALSRDPGLLMVYNCLRDAN